MVSGVVEVFSEVRTVSPCRAGDEVAAASRKASRSRRRDDDCLSAELKREFCNCWSAIWSVACEHDLPLRTIFE